MSFVISPLGVAGIAYAANGLAVIYECDGGLAADDTCPPSKTSIEVLRRDTSDALTEAEISELKPIAQRLCHKAQDFKRVEHNGELEFVHHMLIECETGLDHSQVSITNGCVVYIMNSSRLI